MIPEFVQRFDERKDDLRARFSAAQPDTYTDIVRKVVEVIRGNEDSWEERPDPARIHQIDDGDYQGTLVFVIGADGYQPSAYWYVRISYGSCSGCDTLEAIRCYSDEPPTPDQVDQYMTLALHVVQRMKQMDGEAA